MKRITVCVVGLWLALTTVWAGSPDGIRAEMEASDKQLQEAYRRLYASEQMPQLRKTLSDAEAALRKAIAEIPAVKEIDTELVQVRNRMIELQRNRQKLIENDYKEALADQTKTVEAAREALRQAMSGGEIGALRERKMQLMRQLAEAEKK